MRFASFAIALGFLALGLASRPALAATSTASMMVSATVQSTCQASAPVTAFGSHPATGRSPVSVTCSIPTPYDVTLSAGGTTDPAKTLLNSALLSGSVLTMNRGRAASTVTLAKSGSGSSLALAVYGQRALGQYVSSGAFADAITITITY